MAQLSDVFPARIAGVRLTCNFYPDMLIQDALVRKGVDLSTVNYMIKPFIGTGYDPHADLGTFCCPASNVVYKDNYHSYRQMMALKLVPEQATSISEPDVFNFLSEFSRLYPTMASVAQAVSRLSYQVQHLHADLNSRTSQIDEKVNVTHVMMTSMFDQMHELKKMITEQNNPAAYLSVSTAFGGLCS